MISTISAVLTTFGKVAVATALTAAATTGGVAATDNLPGQGGADPVASVTTEAVHEDPVADVDDGAVDDNDDAAVEEVDDGAVDDVDDGDVDDVDERPSTASKRAPKPSSAQLNFVRGRS